MFTVPATKETRAIGVLLGGSGRARTPPRSTPRVAALMKPFPSPYRERNHARAVPQARDGPRWAEPVDAGTP